MEIMSLFKVMIMCQLFFSVGVSMFIYSMPDDAVNHIDSFSDLSDSIDLENVSSEVQSNIERQTNIPIIDVGALVFYSGNILLDLLLNFVFAIPEMIGLIISGITRLFSFDAILISYIQLFSSVALIVWYFISLIQLITGIRSGRIV